MRVEIDKELCIGCGSCEAMTPDLYKLNSEMKSEVVGKMEDYSLEQLIESAEVCPMRAIKVYDGVGKLVYPREGE